MSPVAVGVVLALLGGVLLGNGALQGVYAIARRLKQGAYSGSAPSTARLVAGLGLVCAACAVLGSAAGFFFIVEPQAPARGRLVGLSFVVVGAWLGLLARVRRRSTRGWVPLATLNHRPSSHLAAGLSAA